MKKLFIIYVFLISSQSIFSQNTIPQQIKNYEAFAKLYGYVRYFHPSDEASEVDWNKFVYYSVQQLDSVKDNNELKAKLNELFSPIAPTVQLYSGSEKPIQLKQIKNTDNLKLVTWQYSGLQPNPGSIYKSIRLGRIDSTNINNYIYQEIVNVNGDKYRFHFYAKANFNDSLDFGDAIISGYYNNRSLEFSEQTLTKKIKDNNWKYYEITGDLKGDLLMFLQFSIFGNGQLFIDSCGLEVLKYNKWESVQIQNNSFETINKFNLPNFWISSNYGCNYKLCTDNAYHGKSCLQIDTKANMLKGSLFPKHAEYGDVIDKKLANGLHCHIPLAVYSDSIHTIEYNKNNLFSDLLNKLKNVTIDSLKGDDKYMQIANIVITWNLIQHFYPYKEYIKGDWNVELQNTLQEILSKNLYLREFYNVFAKMAEKTQDAHSYIYKKGIRGIFEIPIEVGLIDSKIIVTLSDTGLFNIGDEILDINGIRAMTILKSNEELVSGSIQKKERSALMRMFLGKPNDTLIITVKRYNEIYKKSVVRNFDGYVKNNLALKDIMKLENNIYYININIRHAKMSQIDSIMPDLSTAKGVIFDLRGYPNWGSQGIISHLIDEPILSDKILIPQIIYPDYENIVDFDSTAGWIIEPLKPKINGKVVFLTGRGAYSYTESILGIIEHNKLAELVGDTTGGCNGDINRHNLLGGFTYTFTGLKVVKRNGTPHHLVGIRPTIPVRRTIEGIKEGKDEVLEKAIEFINKN